MARDNGFSDKLKSVVSRTKGEVKDQVGNATDDPRLQREGKFDKTKGKFQKTIGKLKRGS
jgi:uncharacterized protein YjbJ (UPF0337 family)